MLLLFGKKLFSDFCAILTDSGESAYKFAMLSPKLLGQVVSFTKDNL